MRLEQPRVPPLPESAWDPSIAERLQGRGAPPNVMRTIAHHPQLYKRWSVFGNHVFEKSTLPPRERELVMLRIGWRCGSAYEFGQHTLIGRRCGLTDDEIHRLTLTADAPGWDDFDRTLVQATDELHDDSFITEPTWQALSARYGTEQLIDLVFTVGQYTLVSMALNTFGVQLDDGVPGFPEGAGQAR